MKGQAVKGRVLTSQQKSSKTRQIVVSFAILLLTFGLLGWQWNLFQARQAQWRQAQWRQAQWRQAQWRQAMAEAPPGLETLGLETPGLEWRVPTEAERQKAVAVIKLQLEDFKRDNYQVAMKHQCKSLRANFASPEQFRQVIRRGYPQFARYRSVEFGSDQIDKAGMMFRVPATVTGADGKKAQATYSLILEEGSWRISGVYDVAERKLPDA